MVEVNDIADQNKSENLISTIQEPPQNKKKQKKIINIQIKKHFYPNKHKISSLFKPSLNIIDSHSFVFDPQQH